MKQKFPIVLCVLIGLILSSCKPSNSSAPFPAVTSSSQALPTLAAFSAGSINKLTEQSSFRKGAITYSEFSPDAKSIGVVTSLDRDDEGQDRCPTGQANLCQASGHCQADLCQHQVQKRLDRFTLRTKAKVDVQWKLFALVHNIGKIHHYGVTSERKISPN